MLVKMGLTERKDGQTIIFIYLDSVGLTSYINLTILCLSHPLMLVPPSYVSTSLLCWSHHLMLVQMGLTGPSFLNTLYLDSVGLTYWGLTSKVWD